MLPRQRPAVAGHQVGGVFEKAPEDVGGVSDREVEAGVDAAVADVAVRQPVHAVLLLEPLEIPQVVAQYGGWHGGVLPSWPRGLVVGRAAGEADPVLTHAPQRPGLARIDHDARIDRRRVSDNGLGGDPRLAGRLTTGLDEQPRAAARQLRNRTLTGMPPHHVDEVRVHALDGERGQAAATP